MRFVTNPNVLVELMDDTDCWYACDTVFVYELPAPDPASAWIVKCTMS